MSEGLRLFVRDALEAAIAAVGSLALTIPANVDDAKKLALVVGTAVAAAVIAVARRELLPLVLDWISPKGGPGMKHELVIEQTSARLAHVKVACQGKGCPLCASRAEDRARITSVK